MAKTYEEIFGIEDDVALPEQSGSVAKSYEEIFGIEDEEDDSLERTSSLSSGREEGDPYGIKDLVDDDNFGVIGKFMDQRFGMREGNHTRQDIADAYVNHMRKFNFGQSVTTIGELSYLNAAKRDDNTERLNTAASAYALFDNMKGAFSEGTSGLEKADAVWDYGKALVWDPVNLVSLGIGKLAAQGSFKAVNLGIKKLALETAQKNLGKKALTNPKLLQQEAFIQSRLLKPKVMDDLIKIEVKGKQGLYGKAAKEVSLRNDALATFGVESVASGLIDGAWQTSQRRVGLQDEHSWLQTGANAAIGAGMFGGIYYAMKYVSKVGAKNGDNIGLTAKSFDGAVTSKAAALKLRGIDVTKANKKAIAEALQDPTTLINELKISREAQERWAARVERGDVTRYSSRGDPVPEDVSMLQAFLFGEIDDGVNSKEIAFKGVIQILDDFKIRMPADKAGNKNFTGWLADTIDELPAEAKTEINKAFKGTLGTYVTPYKKLTGFTGKGQGADVMASEMSGIGQKFQVLSMMSKSLREVADITDEDVNKLITAAKAHADPGLPASKLEKTILGAQGIQQSFIKALVTHPATVGLNVMGWSSASVLQSSADMVRAGLYGGAGFYNQVIGETAKKQNWYTLSKLVVGLQKQKVQNILDPRATMEDMLDFMAYNPKMGKEMFRYLNGGIEDDAVLKSLTDMGALTPGAKKQVDAGFATKDPNRVDKLIDGFQTIYGVKAQDIITKSIEFMYNIDKQIILNHKMTYREFIADDNLWEKIDLSNKSAGTKKGWAEMQGAAIEDTLRAVYAKPFGRDIDDKTGIVKIIPFAANAIENMRKIPFIGALVPFGQFFNNTLAHMFDHTGISLIHKPFARSSRDTMELVTKTAVGLTTIGAMGYSNIGNVEEGLAWHEERLSDGTVRSRLYDFPYNFYKAIGYMAASKHVNGELSPDLFLQISEHFGPAGLLRGVSDTGKASYEVLEDIATNPNLDIVEKFGSAVGSSVQMYASGLTRPLDPVNQVVGAFRGTDYIERDKNQGVKSLNYSMRYVDQIFEGLGMPFPNLIGQEVSPEKRNPLATERGRAPIGRLFGFRETPRQSSMQKMFNEVGMPQWRTNIKSYVPEADNLMDGEISDIIEHKSAAIIDTNLWKTGDQTRRKYIISQIMSSSKKEAMSRLENSFDPEDARMALMYKLTKRGGTVSNKDLQEYMADLNINVPIEKLSYNQLRLIDSYAASERKKEKETKMYLD